MITPRNIQHLIEGVKELRKFSPGTRLGIRPILVVNIRGHGIAAKELSKEFAIDLLAAADLLEMKNQFLVRELRRAGASIISWNPLRQSFKNLLLLGMKAR